MLLLYLGNSQVSVYRTIGPTLVYDKLQLEFFSNLEQAPSVPRIFSEMVNNNVAHVVDRTPSLHAL